jgi:cation diffusion facilitator family transporter
VCAFILGKAHNHGHSHHGHDHHHAGHGHDHHDHTESKDLNLKSAYIHVIADAATSVLAIGALIGGWLLGWSWLDPVIGLLGAVVVAVWAKGLLVSTGKVLLDREMDHPVVQEIREVVELVEDAQLRTRITDLHVWRVGKSVYACAISVVTNDPGLTPNHIRERMAVHEEIVHATVEIHRYPNGAV